MIYVFLAHGFEEIEAITTVDVLRRANLDVKTVGVGGKTITGAHGITVHCDILDREASRKETTAIILPGGAGVSNLNKSDIVLAAVDYCYKNNILIGAICAAPMILGEKGILKGKKSTIFPGMESHLKEAVYVNESVVSDGNIITGNGPAASLSFALKIAELLTSAETAKEIGDSMQCHIAH